MYGFGKWGIMPSLRTLQTEIGEWSKQKGWSKTLDEMANPLEVAAKLCLIHSEVSEALEELRVNRISTIVIDGKPEGLASELADIIIRTINLAGLLDIDIEMEVIMKMTYNHKRSYRHGNKSI